MKKYWKKIASNISIIISIIALGFTARTYINNTESLQIKKNELEPDFTFYKKNGLLEIYNSKGYASDIHIIPKQFLIINYSKIYDEWDDYMYSDKGACSIELYDYYKNKVSYDQKKSAYILSEKNEENLNALIERLNEVMTEKFEYTIDSIEKEKYVTISYYDYKGESKEKIFAGNELYPINGEPPDNEYIDENQYTLKRTSRVIESDISIPTVLSDSISYKVNGCWIDRNANYVPEIIYSEEEFKKKREKEKDEFIDKFIEKVIIKNGMLNKTAEQIDSENKEIESLKIKDVITDNKNYKNIIIILCVSMIILFLILIIYSNTMSLNVRSVRLVKGDREFIIVKRAHGTVNWSTKDQTVAIVSNGTVEAKGKGVTTVFASTKRQKRKCRVIVEEPCITEKEIILSVNTNRQIEMEGCSHNNVIWESSDNNIAYIDSEGYITAVSSGTAIITAKVYNKKYTCVLKVVN